MIELMQTLMYIIQGWITHAGAIGVFGASIAEELVSVIPSSIVQIGAGVFIMSGQSVNIASLLKLITQVVIPAALGVTVGSLPYVWISRYYGLGIIDRYGKWIGVTRVDIEKLQLKLDGSRWDDIAFVLLRAFPLVPSVALAIYGGILEMSWTRYIVSTFVGVCIRATVLAGAGWLFADAIGGVEKVFSQLENIGIIIIIVGGVYFLWQKLYTKNKSPIV